MKLKNILAENMRRFGTKNLNEQADQNFINAYFEDFKKQGWTLENGGIKTLTKNDMQIMFNGGALIGIKIRTKINPPYIVKNKDLANEFAAYDIHANKLRSDPQGATFDHWEALQFASSAFNGSTIGKTKESTPFYKYFDDIIKLSQVSDERTAFNKSSEVDQIKSTLKVAGQYAKGVGQQIKGVFKKTKDKIPQSTTQQPSQP